MDDSFGARLRDQREKRGISLRTIANQTKIKLSLLEGLERDDIRHWPAGIFRRAYVRTYAIAIGLDPDIVVREFVERYPAPIDLPDPPPPPPNRLRSLFDSALESLRSRIPPESSPVDLPPPDGEPRTFDLGPRTPDAGPRTPDVSPRTSDVGLRASDIGLRTSDAGLRASDIGLRTSDAGPDLLEAARLCTELGRVEDGRQLPPLLHEVAVLLQAKGLIVWVWDALANELKPALVHGYPARMLSQMRGVKADADNLTAAAFRSAETCAFDGEERASGALAIPLLTAAACAGVLAIELPHGSAQVPAVRAVATFLAAVLAQVIGASATSSSLEAQG